MSELAMESRSAAPPQNAGGHVVEVSDLHKEYATPAEPLVVLRGVSLSLSAGDSAAVLGPSGSGKSTLLHILGTLDRPTRGRVSIGGVDPFALSPGELARFRSQNVGFIFQDHHLLPQCTALENVLVARMAAGKVRPEDVERARSLFARVSLSGRETHHPYQMSGGERQRVVIARALMNRPPLLLADEPTGNLDSHTARLVGELLRELVSESHAALIVVTHSTALAELFPRQMRMDDGRLVPV